VLVNIDTIVWTEATAQTLSTVVLDTPVAVRVTPVDFTWDFGDGSEPVRTTDPGAPYPDHTVSHSYKRAAKDIEITVTTRWAGQFQVAGSGAWQAVQGFAVTTQTSAPFEVRTATTALTRR
jgi:PKD repeat protein